MNILGGSQNAHVDQICAYQVDGAFHLHAAQISASEDTRSLPELLQPIQNASHTRDRKRSPPDSACMRGTRLGVVKNLSTWASSKVMVAGKFHIRWMHGYVGSGKSSISQEVCDTSDRQERPVVSFFFFRNEGDRSKIWRLATTLACQMAAVVPETEPFIRAAVKANPALLSPDEAGFSLGARMQRLIYGPFKAVVQKGTEVGALSRGPLLIVLDGLDECDNKDEVQELIDGMLLFFDENPLIPLRVFITSRVEQHIKSHLNVPGVQLDDLVDHCSDDDIDTFLQILFKDGCSRDSVVQAYVKQHGEWPSQSDRLKLVTHIGGSFIFASAVFKFIMGLNNATNLPTSQTPMDRLPLALEMNPGLDGLYAETLARSKDLPYFPDIISTIALLEAPLPTAGIAELLGIKTYEVVNVLVHMQAIIQVPGTDDLPVTLCHTSLREFLTTPSRSHQLCAQQSYHVRLFLRCLECQAGVRLQTDSGSLVDPKEFTGRPAVAYALRYSLSHLISGQGFFKISESDRAIQLCREAATVSPGTPYSIHALANVVYSSARHTGSATDLDNAIGLYREALELRRPHNPDRPSSLAYLANALLDRYWRTGKTGDLEEAILLYRQALGLRPFPHAGRLASLFNFGNALLERYQSKQVLIDLEEAVSLHREALALRPSPHPDRPLSLNSLGNALLDRYRRTRSMSDLEEAVSLHRQALTLRSPPHPGRSDSLNNLGNALLDRYRSTRTLTDLEEAISLFRNALGFQLSVHHRPSPAPLSNLVICLRAMYEESHALPHLVEAINGCQDLLDSYYPFGHANRVGWLGRLAYLLKVHFDATGDKEDLTYIKSLEEETSELSALLNSNPVDLGEELHALAGRFQLKRCGIIPACLTGCEGRRAQMFCTGIAGMKEPEKPLSKKLVKEDEVSMIWKMMEDVSSPEAGPSSRDEKDPGIPRARSDTDPPLKGGLKGKILDTG